MGFNQLCDSITVLNFVFRKGFHSVNEQYKEANEPKVKLTSSEMCNNGANWQFRKTPSF